MSKEILHKRLKDEMHKQNWSGRKLSTKANLSYNAIHYILSGKTKSTNFDAVNAIASVLGVSPFYLLDENYKTSNNKSESRKLHDQKKIEDDVPYNGELYRQIMSVVEEVLSAKSGLTTQRIEYFTHYIYSQINKTESSDQEKNIRSYAEGIIDYALNKMD
ncbi:MAG: transcriptional regulator with XRE-family HTH domain [Myxococcota bacterium]|jgi:transcriptional regulator with XRE-family HTH domain